jgi:hypothetical protein
MRKLLILLAGCGTIFAAPPTNVTAAGAKGCDGFLWPLATERAWLRADDSEKVASGATLAAPPAGKAFALSLLPASKVTFATKPTSTPKPEDAGAFGGVVTFDAPTAGHYQITLSAHGWIDVIQNGAPLEATGHTGSADCDGIRKSVRFEIGPGPYSLQVSGLKKDSIKIAIRPAAD